MKTTKMLLSVTVVIALLLAPFEAAASDQGLCRHVLQVHYKDGKKSVTADESRAANREECESIAKSRQVSLMGDKVQKVRVMFGFRGPAMVSEAGLTH